MSTTTYPDTVEVLRLQAVQGYPAVSLLLNTTPGAVMSAQDAATLHALHAEAVARLGGDERAGDTARLLDRLDRLVRDATHSPTAQALAVFAHRSTGSALRLSVPVTDRVVIDPTFATRDLVRALHRTPQHLVLCLTSTQARLFQGADELRPVHSHRFPLSNDRDRRRSASRPGLATADTTAFLRIVDRAFGTYLRLHPAPVVLVGEERVVNEYERLSSHLDRCAGTLRANVTTEPLTRIAERVRPLLHTYLLSRQDEALALLERRLWADRAAVGLPAAWLAARHDRPEMLAVEESLFQAARIGADGDTLDLVNDPHQVRDDPDVVDDIVDELIELVLRRGGWVALVEDGRLAGNGGVALTLKRT
ncbi:hypothetical protein [Jannaschia sp. R86511]|uniref:baeRF3 domain-containing protein n=1 Tax=Jannaschia sp. R86511 TaxID=3093853 RepID=UPI0036D36E8D